MTEVNGGGGVPEGTKLNDMYEVGTRIAMGGMGEVYTGKQIQTGQKVAIKMILPEHANNELILELFRKEANTLHDVYHEAIVRYFVFSVDPTLNRPYMAMEFAGGPALGDRLVEKGPLDEREMTVLRKRIAGGLHAAHKKGVVHRDISSDNIILVNDTVEDAKIIDFGIAKSSSSEGTLIGSGFAGKLNYVSPEQLGLAGGEVTAKSDIYSLGLVFAEAAIGKPLPMGGSHVEVTEKRRVVPDLSEVPLHVRPLIEWMLQPEPDDRPADLEAVANWDGAAVVDTGATMVAGATGGAQGVHPRDRLKQAQESKDKKKGGTPWVLIGVGGAAVAAAAVGAVMFLGGEQPAVNTGGTGGGSLIQGDTSTNLAGSLSAPVQAAQAPSATIGEPYDWSTPAFAYNGDPSALSITQRGSLPAGLIFQVNKDGSAQISGTPTVDGTYSIGVVAISPEEDRASISVQLTVDPAPAVVQAPATPTTLQADLTAPSSGGSDDAGINTGASGGSVLTTQSDKLGAGASVPSQPTTPSLTQPTISQPETPKADTDAAAVSTSGSGLTLPSTGGDNDLQVATVTPTTPTQPSTGSTAPTLQSGGTASSGSSLTTQPRQSDSEATDNAAASSEPTVNTSTSAVLQPTQPSDGGTSLSTGGASDGGFTIPSTGATQLGSPAPSSVGGSSPTLLQPSTPSSSQPTLSTGLLAPAAPTTGTDSSAVSAGTGSGGTGLALPTTTGSGGLLSPQAPSGASSNTGIAALPENSPPTIVSSLNEPLGAARNVPIDSIIGTFFDNEGPENLRLQIEGFLPAGVSARLTSEGRVQLTGTPMEYGSFPLRIAAVDPEGAISEAFVFTLNINETKDNLRAWKYVANYPGGECTLSRPDVLTETSAIVEVFAAESAIDRIYQLNDDFIRDMGFEADFNVRLITDNQCPLIYALDQVGPEALDNALVISLDRDELGGNDRLVGKLQGGEGAKLYLYDSEGGLHDLSRDLRTVSGETGFDIEMAGTGAQILIAAKPRPGANIDPSQGIEFLLGAAQRGEASLALGYFTMQ